MSAYLIEVRDTKEGVCYPPVVGPFPNRDAAERFAEELGMGTADPFEGGYAEVHVICAETCDYTPETYREENHEQE